MNKAELRRMAELAAQAVPVTKVAEGVSLGLTDKDWNRACDDRGLNGRIAERHVVTDHMGRERVRNGLGEWVS